MGKKKSKEKEVPTSNNKKSLVYLVAKRHQRHDAKTRKKQALLIARDAGVPEPIMISITDTPPQGAFIIEYASLCCQR